MVFNATFNNISVISWRSVLLVEETGVPGETSEKFVNEWLLFNTTGAIFQPYHDDKKYIST